MFATTPLRRRETLRLHKSTQEGNNIEAHGGSTAWDGRATVLQRGSARQKQSLKKSKLKLRTMIMH